MRLLLVADVSAEKVIGGAERMLVNHLRALRDAGHAVTLLTRQPGPDADLCVEVAPGVQEHRLPFSGDKGLHGMLQLRAGARTWWATHGSDFDALVAEQPFVMWAVMRAGCSLPRLQVCHSFAFQEYATRHGLGWGGWHRLLGTAMRRLEAGMYRSADRLLVLSRHMQRELQACFGVSQARVDVAPGGVLLPASMPAAARARHRKRLGWDGPVVITLRNLVPRTGVDMLLQAAAIVRRSRPDVRWCVMGSGTLQEPLRWLAGQLAVDDIVEFTGYLDEQEALQRMQAADAFMIPTRSLEGFGLVTIEANACGLPVVATPVGGNIEVASTSPDNRLAEAISPESLADATLALLAAEAEHGERARRLRRHVRGHFAWARHDAALLAALEKLPAGLG